MYSIIVNLVSSQINIYIFIFRRYCNKNNTFPNVGHSVPLKIFNSSPGCVFFLLLHCCRHKVHRQTRDTQCRLALFLFFLSLSCFVCGWSTFSVRIPLPHTPVLGTPEYWFLFFLFFMSWRRSGLNTGDDSSHHFYSEAVAVRVRQTRPLALAR